MTRELRRIALITGLVCLVLGAAGLTLGAPSMAGGQPTSAGADSGARFAGGILIGFGVAWLWAARTKPLPIAILRALAGVLLLGAAGRLVSLLDRGPPDWPALVQLGVETVIPIVVLGLTTRIRQQAVRTD